MIISGAYFIGEIYQSQLGTGGSTKVNNDSKAQIFIDQYEREILKFALGEKLRREFYSNLEPDGTVTPGADAKWSRLRNGYEYTKDSITYYWKGLVQDEGTTYLTSLMAYYVYYMYVKNEVTQVSTLGIVKADAENTRSASAIPKLTRSWRKLYDWYMGTDSAFNANLHNNPNVYFKRGIEVRDYYRGDNTKEVSLFQFLTDNESDYPDWFFTPIDNINKFGI